MYSARPLRPVEPTRDEWCRNHPRGHLSTVFQPGETMRCPRTRTLNSGRRRPCGGYLGMAPLNTREVVVRAIEGRPPIQGGEMRTRTCASCHKTVDLFLIPEARTLEAAG